MCRLRLRKSEEQGAAPGRPRYQPMTEKDPMTISKIRAKLAVVPPREITPEEKSVQMEAMARDMVLENARILALNGIRLIAQSIELLVAAGKNELAQKTVDHARVLNDLAREYVR